MVYIIVGTGVGAAIIENGQLLRGKDNSAGEVGHITLNPHGELCSCGSRGCVETYMGGPWLAKRYLKALAAQARSEGSWAVEQEAVTGEQVANLAVSGDPLAQKILMEAGEALGIAVATMAMILNIELFVVGASVAKMGDLLLEPARQMVLQHSYRSVGCGVKLVASEINEDSVILGCAWQARQAAQTPEHLIPGGILENAPLHDNVLPSSSSAADDFVRVVQEATSEIR